jgi:hypothetical protein
LLRDIYQAGNLGESGAGAEFERVSAAYKNIGFRSEPVLYHLSHPWHRQLKRAMDFLNSVFSSFCAPDEGELPSEGARLIVAQLKEKLNTSYSDEAHELLLRDIYQAGNLGESGAGAEFERVSAAYKNIGFQREDPISDLRGGGVLSLENIHHMLLAHNTLAMDMIRRRSDREDGANYPWAAAGVNVTRMVAILFEVISASGAPMPRTHTGHSIHSRKKYWHLLEDEGAFERIYMCAFVLLDRTFTLEKGDYMKFPGVVALTNDLFEQMLERMETVAELEAELLAPVAAAAAAAAAVAAAPAAGAT